MQCNVDWIGLCQLGCGCNVDWVGLCWRIGLGWVVSVGICSVMLIGLGCVSWDVHCSVDWIGLCQLGCAVYSGLDFDQLGCAMLCGFGCVSWDV